ncbi:MAG: chemotaxis response regulator protein-glutamate methylesterase [Anaerolineaceae bacterium]|nr:chemotaxis response regulator protein-glutamate methylesterase [Anaerolineaceae bacterium]
MNTPSIMEESPIRVLIVDDSAFMRFTIAKRISESPRITVVGSAKDGIEALELIPKLNPDVITLDVEMPRLDGLSTLKQIMEKFPRPVIMLSSLTKEGALETVQALTYGAVDFIAKPDVKANMSAILDDVEEKIIVAAKAKVKKINRSAIPSIRQRNILATVPAKKVEMRHRNITTHDRIVVIGSSTGGPRALNTLIPALPIDPEAAYVVIQHMPVGFTRSLAERLHQNSWLSVKEAEPGDQLKIGQVLLAPGGFHMVFDKTGTVKLNQNPPMHGVRPAVDVTLISLAQNFGSQIISVTLTGMGNDGTTGATLVNSSGGIVLAESEESCVVWGMPRSIYEAGIADKNVHINDMSTEIVNYLKGTN